MLGRKNSLILFSLISLCIVGCTSGIKTEEEYIGWINDESNGCYQKKEVKNILFSAKYLPTEYLVLREMSVAENDTVVRSAIAKEYENGIHIYFRIDPVNEASGVDIMYADVYSSDEFRQRVYDMNFNLKEMFYIEIKGQKVSPSLFHMENDYGLSSGRGMHIVFSKELMHDSEELDFTLVFDDAIFSSGINKFKFIINKRNIPEII